MGSDGSSISTEKVESQHRRTKCHNGQPVLGPLMKITKIRMIGERLPVSHIALLQVETDQGPIGIGATQAPGPVIAALVQDIQPMLIGQDPTCPHRLWRTMNESWQAQRGRGGEGGMAVNAMAAIDMALWDITGKALQRPIHQLMGGAVKDRIMVYASATAYDYLGSLAAGHTVWKTAQQLSEESQTYVAEGFRAIKFGWSNRFTPTDIDCLAAIRDAIGPDTLLMLDFGCPAYHQDGWTVQAAMEVIAKLEPFNIFFFEEALHPYDVDGFAQLTSQSAIRIATGESLVTLSDFDHFIKRRALDIIQPDAQQIGLTVFRQVVRQAEAAGMLCIPHSPWSALGEAAHLQILSTFSNGLMIEYVAMAGFRGVPFQETFQEAMTYRIVDTPPKLKDGYLELSDRPGLGLGQFVPEVINELEQLDPIEFP